MKNLAVLVAFLHGCAPLFSQSQTQPPPRVVDFTITPEGEGYRFRPIAPPLLQKAGAPEAFWTYYWEFGDGSFSFEESPLHVYAREGAYRPLLEATAHYDDGKLPDKNGKGIIADCSGSQPGEFPTVFDSLQLPVQMKATRQARANEALVCILSYRNLGIVTTDGRLHLFFNERRFAASHFALDSARAHAQEFVDASFSQVLPSDVPPTQGWTVLELPTHTGLSTSLASETNPPTILQNLLNNARAAYREEKTWRFSNLAPNEKRNLFFELRGTDKMLQDTNAFIHLEAIFAPFDPVIAPERFELEFEIVSSHDPNAIIVSDSRVNYRRVGSKKLDYKVQFQNNGEGPASTVELKVEIPEGLDMKRMRPMDWYPKCPICPPTPTNRSCLDTASSKEGLLFTFRNIYLPGSRQKNVNDRDSTKGFVRYRLDAERGMPKLPFRSRAKITFDKNAPIFTNFTRTRFQVGKSPGLKVGYGFEPNFKGAQSGETVEDEKFVQGGHVFLGLSLSPYKSWRAYPQVELLVGIKGRGGLEETSATEVQEFPIMDSHPLLNGLRDTVLTKTVTQTTRGFVSFEVPALLRKNFNRWLGAGVGASARIILDNGESSSFATTDSIQYRLVDSPNGTLEVAREVAHSETQGEFDTFSAKRFDFAAFGDLTFGAVRQGLNLGIRGGVLLERKRTLRPFVQVSLELKL